MDYCHANDLIIPRQCYTYNLDERIPFDVWIDILQFIEKQHMVPALGLKIAEYIKPSYAGIITYVALSKATLIDSIPDFIHYRRLGYDFNAMHISIKNDLVYLTWGSNLNKSNLLVDTNAIAIFIGVIRQIIFPQKLNLVSLELPYDLPDELDLYESFFGCPVYFNGSTMVLTASLTLLKQISLPETDPVLNFFIKKQADHLLQQLHSYDQFEEKVKIYIIACIKNKKANIEAVSQRIGLSVKELREKLNDKGLSFYDILKEVREDLAKQYLRDYSLNINEIAELLGYAEQSVFQRAFKTWVGQTPLKWRSNQQNLLNAKEEN